MVKPESAARSPRRATLPPDQFLAVLDLLPGMVGVWDRDLRNVLANQAYSQYFGIEPDAMNGMHIRDVLGEAVFHANYPYLLGTLAGEEQLFDRTLIDQAGHVRHTQAAYVPWRDSGKVVGLVVLVSDVTERVLAEQRLKASADQYRALARSVPGGFVLLFDEELRFVIAEGLELGTFGHTQAGLEGRTIFEAFSAELAEELLPRYRAALAGQTVSWERTVRDRTFALSAAPVADDSGGPFAGMVIASDITEQRRSEAIRGALLQIARAVAQNGPAAEIAQQIAASLTVIFGVHTAAVVCFDGPASGHILAMSPTHLEGVPQHLTFTPEDWSAVAQVARTGDPARVDYQPVTAGVVGALRSEGLSAGAAAPIHHQGNLWGAISVATANGDQLSADMLDQLTAFAELLEIAVGNLHAWSALSEQAAADPLTGLPNRRTFELALHREIGRAERQETPFSVVVIDIDHFKAINDAHGHAAGDGVLVEVANRLKTATRGSEIVARIGGEEFSWLLPDTDSGGATIAADRALRAINSRPFPGIGQVTISLGIASSDLINSPDDIVQAADQALYNAKRNGRNKSATYTN